MVSLYVTLIRRGARTFETVPDDLKDLVRLYLNKLGLDENGKPIEKTENL